MECWDYLKLLNGTDRQSTEFSKFQDFVNLPSSMMARISNASAMTSHQRLHNCQRLGAPSRTACPWVSS